jgi:hypothetical protein
MLSTPAPNLLLHLCLLGPMEKLASRERVNGQLVTWNRSSSPYRISLAHRWELVRQTLLADN